MDSQLRKHVALLGMKVRDKVSGFHGVVSSVAFDLYGCVQVVIDPPVDKDGTRRDGHWFDVSRITVTGKTPVMDAPNFVHCPVAEGGKGAAEKPARR